MAVRLLLADSGLSAQAYTDIATEERGLVWWRAARAVPGRQAAIVDDYDASQLWAINLLHQYAEQAERYVKTVQAWPR